jgi:hypothetical protein
VTKKGGMGLIFHRLGVAIKLLHCWSFFFFLHLRVFVQLFDTARIRQFYSSEGGSLRV